MRATQLLAALFSFVFVSANPYPENIVSSRPTHKRFFDVQGHRGGRGIAVENTLPGFAWGLIHGATTLEMDNGITKDGHVVVWHDESIEPYKCRDTAPAVPNMTLSQIKTLDCGSVRQTDYPLQLIFPGTQISTLQEVFDFVECADPEHQVLFNIESKIDAEQPNRTLAVSEFVTRQHRVFAKSPYKNSITYQSFDWRTIISMKKLDPQILTSALVDELTVYGPERSTSPWLAGLRPDQFNGSTLGEQLAEAAKFISADILSPEATYSNGAMFTTKAMVARSHALGIKVKPWTVNNLNVADALLDWKVDGIITDFPDVLRRWAKQQALLVAPKYPKQRVLSCLQKHTS
ncbi:PLC-like phosphodiesterase [Sistotremastrum niveocremeum HHB9708]|uniref:PLC-like phosphodiesterase n=1 Tax=Sistotremastrum niveocremeum HHB9708 TaxID=1314777 RepID=A0A164XPH0_9AGAM|nr:PLC-like phosphodiesterase [Sistotremastrum niveocremeum HHB9708]